MKKNVDITTARTLSAALAIGIVSTGIPANAVPGADYYNAARNAVQNAQKLKTQASIDEAQNSINLLKEMTNLDNTRKVRKLVKSLAAVQKKVYSKVHSAIIKFKNSQNKADYFYSQNLITALLNSSSGTVASKGSGYQRSLDASRASVKSVSAQTAKTVAFGTAVSNLGLPTSVNVKLSNGRTAPAAVNWNTSSYNPSKTGKYTFIGTLSVPNDKYYNSTPLTASIDVTVKEGSLDIASVYAIGAKKIQVKFSSVVDTSAARFDIKRDGFSINIAKVTYSDDKTSAVIELPSKISRANYTVTVYGLTSAPMTKSFSGEDERVTAINILSDSAPVDNSSAIKYATVGYRVTNQYGEDITSTAYVQTGNNNITAVNGVVTISGSALGTPAAIGNRVLVTLINAQNGVAASKLVTLSSAASPSSVTVTGLYNKDNKELNENTNLAYDKFYILLDLRDQYGNPITSTSAGKMLIMTQSNANVVQAQADSSNSMYPALTNITVNGQNRLAVQLKPGNLNAGENTVTFICTMTGNKSSYTIKVNESTKADTVTLSQPAQAIAGEDLYIPVSVLDRSGSPIRDVNVLNSDTKGVTITYGGVKVNSPFIIKDNQLYVYIRNSSATPVKEGYTVILAQTSSYKISTLPISIRAAAKPVMIEGLKSSVSTTLSSNAVKNISIDDLLVEDQYGRTMSRDQLYNALNYGNDISAIKITEVDTNNRYVSINLNQITRNSSIQLKAGGSNGTKSFYISLIDKSGRELSGSTAYISIRVTDGTEYRSYNVDPIGTVYDELSAGRNDNNAYDKAINVYGVLDDGSKVQLTAGLDYTVTSTNPIVAADVSTDNRLDANYKMYYEQGKTTTTVPVTVTINSTGQQFTQNVTFSDAAPQVARINVVNDHALNAGSVSSINATPGSTFGISNIATAASGRCNILATDQYGVSQFAGTNGIITFPDGTTIAAPSVVAVPVRGAIRIVNNGLSTISISEIDPDDQFNVTVTYAGGQSDTITVLGK